jgi:hypothetical protein
MLGDMPQLNRELIKIDKDCWKLQYSDKKEGFLLALNMLNRYSE